MEDYNEKSKGKKLIPIIVVILVIILAIVGLRLLNVQLKFKKTADEKYEELRVRICEAAEKYVTSNDNISLEVEKSMQIKYQKLSDANLIEAKIENPYYTRGIFQKTTEDKYYSMDNSVRITHQPNDTYTCELVDNSKDVTAPELRLIGDEEIELLVGTEFQDPGYTATDDFDGDITDKVTRSGNVDINKAGEYTLTYTAQDSAGNTTTKTRKFIYKELSDIEVTLGSIVDNVAPMIQLKGSNPYCMVKGTKYIEPGATAIDNVDGNITEYIAITNKVTGNMMGTFRVVYTAEDSSGNKSTVYRTVLVSTSCYNVEQEEVEPVNSQNIFEISDLLNIEKVKAADLAAKAVINTAPILTLIGKNSVTIQQGTQYIDLGATAYDREDGDLTRKITADQSMVNINVPGVYRVIYRVTDNGINGRYPKTVTATRTVTVIAGKTTTKTRVNFIEDKENVTVTVGQGKDELIKAPKAIDENAREVRVITAIEDYTTKEAVKRINWDVVRKYRVTYTAIHNSGKVRQTKSIVVNVVTSKVEIGGKTSIVLKQRKENCDITEIDLVEGGVTFTSEGTPTVTVLNGHGIACRVGSYKVQVRAESSEGVSTEKTITVQVRAGAMAAPSTEKPGTVEILRNSANAKDPYNTSKSYVGGTITGIEIEFSATAMKGGLAYFEYSKDCNTVSGKIAATSSYQGGPSTGRLSWKEEGENKVCIRAVGSNRVPGEWSDPVYLYLDLTGPEARFTHDWADGSNDWHNTSLTLKYTAEDELSGLDHFEYTYDDVKAKKASDIKTYYEATGELTVNENTEASRPMLFVYVRAVDKVGNKGEWTLKPAHANIDTIAPNVPTLEAIDNGTKKASVGAIYTDNSSIRPSGPNGVIYKIDGGNEQISKAVINNIGVRTKKVVNVICNSNTMNDAQLKNCLARNALREEWYRIDLPINTTGEEAKYDVEAWSVDKAGNRSIKSATISVTKASNSGTQIILKNGNKVVEDGESCSTKIVNVGDIVKLSATLEPSTEGTKAEWYVSDESIAEVNEKGEVRAKKLGTTNVEVDIDGLKTSCVLEVTSRKVTCPKGTYLPLGKSICEKCLANHYCVGVTSDVNEAEDQGIKECEKGQASEIGASKCSPKTLRIVIDKNFGDMGEVEQTFTYNEEEEIDDTVINTWENEDYKLVGLSDVSNVDNPELKIDEKITKEFIDENCDEVECTINLHAIWKSKEQMGASAGINSVVVIDDGGGGSSKPKPKPTACYASNCYACQSGSSTRCATCRAGTRNSGGTCVTCGAGTYSGAGSTTCKACPAGKYSGAGAGSCKSCKAGTYSKAGAGSCTACPANTYSGAGAASCTPCPSGTTSPAGSTSSAACKAASYSCYACGGSQGVNYTWATSAPSSSCAVTATVMDTSTGKQVTAGAGNCNGSSGSKIRAYCENKGMKYLTCPTGEEVDERDSYGCVKCKKKQDAKMVCYACGGSQGVNYKWASVSPGSSCAVTGTVMDTSTGKQVPANAGNCNGSSGSKIKAYCEAKGMNYKTCPSGYEAESTDSNGCVKCKESLKVTCKAGYYHAPNTDPKACNAKCLAGSYCPGGTYTASTNAFGIEKCPGDTTSSAGAKSVSACKTKCQPGTYVVGDKCVTCPVGTYSSKTNATSCTQCKAGTYSAGGAAGCTKCPAGTYSAAKGASSCATCKAGTYSKTGSTSCKICGKGTYSSVGSASCTKCPAGSYSASKSSTSCTLCSPGTYNTAEGSTSCTKCKAGTYNEVSGKTTCFYCPAGHYTSNSGTTGCVACPGGTYYEGTGAKSCTKCPAGTYSRGGAKTCAPCPVGTYSSGKGNSTCTKCPSGKTSSAGSKSASSCVAPAESCKNKCSKEGKTYDGIYNPSTKKCECEETTECPAGNHLVGDKCVQCARGTYSPNAGANECFYCPGGTYADKSGMTQCIKCPSGTTSVAGSTSINDCTKNSEEQIVEGDVRCSAGYYHPANADAKSCSTKCPAGSYCPGGVYKPSLSEYGIIQCPAGTYSSDGEAHCTSCPAGKTSPKGSTSWLSCEKVCPAGKYANGDGTECITCPPGYYCTGGGERTGGFMKKCEYDTYSEGGASACTKCPEGTHANYAGSTSINDCKACPEGKVYDSKSKLCI